SQTPVPAAGTPTGYRCKARTRSRTAPCGRPTACDRGSGSAAAPSATAALHVATTRQGLSTAVAHPCARPAILDDHLHETTTRVIILLGPLRHSARSRCIASCP